MIRINNVEVDSLKLYDYNSSESEIKFRYEHLSRIRGWKISYGLGLENGAYTNSTFQRIYDNDKSIVLNYDSKLNLLKYGVFGQFSRKYMEDRLILSFGIRMDGNDYSSKMSNPLSQLSPRISASYALNEKLYLNFNMGRYYQHPAYTTLGYRNNEGMLVNKQNNLKYIQSDHIVAGVEYQPAKSSRITVEGFYKHYNNYPWSVKDSISLSNKGGGFGVLGDEEVLSTAIGRSYGLEFLAREKLYKGFNVIISYTLYRSEFDKLDGTSVASAWDNRHLFNLILLKKFKNNWDIGLKWRYVGGAPYTPYDLETSAKRPAWDLLNQAYLDYGNFNTLRYSDFHQLDIRIDKQFFFKEWSLMLYVDVQNVYNFQANEQGFITNLDANGNPVIMDPTLPYNEQNYELRTVSNVAGTIFPTVGIIVEL